MTRTSLYTTLGLLATLAAASAAPVLADPQSDKNNMRNLAIAGAAVAGYGLLNHNNAATLLGAAGAALAGGQYEKDRQQQSQNSDWRYDRRYHRTDTNNGYTNNGYTNNGYNGGYNSGSSNNNGYNHYDGYRVDNRSNDNRSTDSRNNDNRRDWHNSDWNNDNRNSSSDRNSSRRDNGQTFGWNKLQDRGSDNHR